MSVVWSGAKDEVVRAHDTQRPPQDSRAAITQGLDDNSFRWAYHAKVMNTLDGANSPAVYR